MDKEEFKNKVLSYLTKVEQVKLIRKFLSEGKIELETALQMLKSL